MGKIRKALAVILSLVMIATVIPVVKRTESVQAAESFSVISPKENRLMAAGYFDIQWSEATQGAVKAYKVYIDDALVETTTDTVYEYYTTTVKMYTVYVTAEYTNGTTETTDTVSFGVTKKGLAVNNTMGKNLDPVDMSMGWYYTWGTNPFSYPLYKNLEFVPMIWGAGNETGAINGISVDYKYLLSYNEPDMGGNVGGSNVSVDTAVANWPKFLGGDYYLSAPAPALSPSWDSGTWFRNFMDRIDQDTVDFIPLHCYYDHYGGEAGANTFLREVVDATYEMYHKPIWVTEFAVSGWEYSNEAARASVEEFMYTVIDGLNERPYVERYSWFSFNTTASDANGASALWTNETGVLTRLGCIYADYGNPEGYVATYDAVEQPPYSVTSSTRTTAYSSSVTINGTTCEDYVEYDGVSATASSAINNDSGAEKAIDGEKGTRWESVQKVDPQTFTLDLGAVRNVKQINILWENASARDYTIEVSSDGINYTQIVSLSGMEAKQNRNDTIRLNNLTAARYIKITGTARATDYGYSIWEMAVYGTDDAKVDETEAVETTTRENMSVRPEKTTEPPKATDADEKQSSQTGSTAEEPATSAQSGSGSEAETTAAVEKSSSNATDTDTKVGTTKVKKAVKKKSAKIVKISLKRISGVAGYQVWVYKSKTAKKALVKKNVKKAKFTLKSKKLKNRKKLYVRARAYKLTDSGKVYGTWSKRKKVKMK